MAEMQAVTGGCHCGAVRYEAKADTSQTVQCNCSHCEKKGFILAFTPRENFRIIKGEDHLTEYRFNRHVIAHQFCETCGVQPFGLGTGPDGSKMAAINMRCVDDIDLEALAPKAFDGRSL
jgi:hypothetical protein